MTVLTPKWLDRIVTTIKSLNLGIMSKTRRSFSASKKLSIINEADQFGITQTLRKHNLSHSVYSN